MTAAGPTKSSHLRDHEAFAAIVSGRVQGVGFRYSARREALRLGLTGWVRNLDDGDVELRAEGPRGALADFREWLQDGPPGAWVERVEARPTKPTGSFLTFDAVP
ncbi:MAG: acylphosphatase [Spirochaetaceae bacterium]|nr:acylphosphatase [Spirochaetaceae bacterium]